MQKPVYCTQNSCTFVVIPGLIRNPVFLNRILTFAGMTTSELMQRSLGHTALGWLDHNLIPNSSQIPVWSFGIPLKFGI